MSNEAQEVSPKEFFVDNYVALMENQDVTNSLVLKSGHAVDGIPELLKGIS